MRLRNKPWAEPFLEENDDLVIKFDEELKDSFEQIFGNNNSLNLEIGTGKGDFIKQLASLNLDKNIETFFRKMNSHQSNINDLNEEVLKWIRENNVGSKIKLSFK